MNKRSDHLATRETAYYILFSAKTRIYINKTHTESGVEKSLFLFSLYMSSYLALKLGYMNKTNTHMHNVELKTLYFNFA